MPSHLAKFGDGCPMSILMILVLAAMSVTVFAAIAAWTYKTINRHHGSPGPGSVLPGAKRGNGQPWNDHAGRRANRDR